MVLVPALIITTMVGASIIAVLVTTAGTAPVFEVSPIVEYGLPAVKGITNLAAAAKIGGLLLAAVVLPKTSPGWGFALDLSAGGALIWTVSAAAATMLTFFSVAGSVRPEILGPSIGQFLTQIELGQAWLATILTASALTFLCFAVRNHSAVALVTILAFAALVPLSLQGHAAGAGSHTAASSALWLHVAASAAWIGGLLAFVLTHRRLPDTEAWTALKRYSTIALVSFIVLATAGTVGAALRLRSPEQLLTTEWGQLLSAKVLILLALGAAGAYYRRNFLTSTAKAPPGRSRIWRLVIAELAVMGVASGFATVLARTPPPVVEQIAVTPSERLTGQELPLPFSPIRALDAWSVDPVWLLVAGLSVTAYVRAVIRLKRQGERWPASRTISWVVGMALLCYVTSGAANIYATYLVSVQMLGQVTLALMVPLLLVLGAPIPLLLRAVPPRGDGSRGVREWSLLLVQSRAAAVLTHPIVTAVLFIGSMTLLLATPVLGWAVEDPVGQQWVNVQFVLVGFLLCQSLIGAGHGARHTPYPLRLLVLLTVMVFLAVFGLALLGGNALLLPDWYGVIAEGWSVDPLSDQKAAGGIAWAVGMLPTLALAAILGSQWARHIRQRAQHPLEHAEPPRGVPASAGNVAAVPAREPDRRQGTDASQ